MTEPLIESTALFAIPQHALQLITAYWYSYITIDQSSELTEDSINGTA